MRRSREILPKLRFIPNKRKTRFNRTPPSQTKSTNLILEPKAISVKLGAVRILLSTESYLLVFNFFI